MRGAACLVALAAGTLALAACDRADMVAQPKAQNWDRTTLFPDQSSMRPPVAGTVAIDPPDTPVPQPATITPAMLARGRERYDVFCAPCHGRTGDGHGMIVERGFPAPPGLAEAGLVKAHAAFLYEVITNGHGVMYGYAAQVPFADRWAIVAYIRALQLSQSADPATLPEAERAALESLP